MANYTRKRGHRRPKWKILALRKLQEEKVEEAERAFAGLCELAFMEEDLPPDYPERVALFHDVMNRVWGAPKMRSDTTNTNTNTEKVFIYLPDNARTETPISGAGKLPVKSR